MYKRTKHPRCGTCQTLAVRVDHWDAYACPACGTWVERPCGDPGCGFCTERPERPDPGELEALRRVLAEEVRVHEAVLRAMDED